MQVVLWDRMTGKIQGNNDLNLKNIPTFNDCFRACLNEIPGLVSQGISQYFPKD